MAAGVVGTVQSQKGQVNNLLLTGERLVWQRDGHFVGERLTPVGPACTMATPFNKGLPSSTSRVLDEGIQGFRRFGGREPSPSNENGCEEHSQPFLFASKVPVQQQRVFQFPVPDP